MFRLHDNVPQVYIEQSRDFLLIARLYDTIISGMKYDIDTIVNLLDATKARDTVLDLMCTKIGFFTRELIDAQVLKYIIASFPYIVKYKGTTKGILYAVNAILKSENANKSVVAPKIYIVNTSDSTVQQEYTVYIYTTVDVYNRVALRELLKYVLPTGYSYQLLSYVSLMDEASLTLFKLNNFVTIDKARIPNFSSVKGVTELLETRQDILSSAYDLAEVPSAAALRNYDNAEPVLENIVLKNNKGEDT